MSGAYHIAMLTAVDRLMGKSIACIPIHDSLIAARERLYEGMRLAGVPEG